MKAALIVIGLICCIPVVCVIGGALLYGGMYASLNGGNQAVKEAFGNVESQLQRRADLVPSLVQVVKGYAKHEHDTFQDVTEARAKVGQINMGDAMKNPEAMKQLAASQGELSGALSRLMVVAENYPELKASQQFSDLQSQLEGTENRINVCRERYNGAVRAYNTAVSGLLTRFVASMNGFTAAEYFEAAPASHTAPKVEFETASPTAS